MNAPLARAAATPWYRVPEMWLIVLLLGSTVIGSLSLVATAVRHPDAHVVVPGDQPRPSRIPPIQPQTSGTDAAVPASEVAP
jgi:hypothetical protein